MTQIINILGREIYDSRGLPTLEADVYLSDGSMGRASVPSGASKGVHEALELRDNDKSRLGGKGVLEAVENINGKIFDALVSLDAENQNEIDEVLINLDGTRNKSNLGANAILAVSLAVAKAQAISKSVPFYRYIGGSFAKTLPVPMMNILNGGVHADNRLDIQEFMIIPNSARSFHQALQMGAEVFLELKSVLKKDGYSINVGDEGGFAPNFTQTKQALDYILKAIDKAGFKVGLDFGIGLDVASTELYFSDCYHIDGKEINSDDMIKYYQNLIKEYPIFSIEDALAEDDWVGWKNLTEELGKRVSLVGDDLFVTNAERLKQGIEENVANTILIKPNQIGTLTETVKVIRMAQKNGYRCIMSHRSGETEDTSICDIAVGMNIEQVKMGSLSRTDRMAKYNALLRIEEELGIYSKYPIGLFDKKS